MRVADASGRDAAACSRLRRLLCLAPASVLLLLSCHVLQAGDLPPFEARVVAEGLQLGYQLLAVDLTRDGRKDLIAIDEQATELVWFENPTWQRHVMAVDVPRPLNADAWDIDGDGCPEIVLAYRFDPRPEQSVGSVVLLTCGADVRQPWVMREIDQVPTAHRVRWIDPEGHGAKVLLVGPLVGRRYPPQEGDKTPIYLYRPGRWDRELLTDEPAGVLHAIHPVHWDGGPRQQLVSASYLGLHRFDYRDGHWNTTLLAAGDPRPWPLCGSSEVRLGHLGETPFLAAIEPWHGNQIVVYRHVGGQWQRTVIEDKMDNGHALAVGDLDGDGRDEIVGGFRGQGFQLSIYQAADAGGQRWVKTVLDDGGIAAVDCVVEDLTGDGRPDIACIGASTGNVKLYENLGTAKP